MRQYLSNHNVTIAVTDVLILSLQSKTDKFIMEPSRLKHYNVRQQKDINLVRIFLQATTTAELTDPSDNTRIRDTALLGQRPTNFISKPGWPRQQSPSKHQIASIMEEVSLIPIPQVRAQMENIPKRPTSRHAETTGTSFSNHKNHLRESNGSRLRLHTVSDPSTESKETPLTR